jgi:transposase
LTDDLLKLREWLVQAGGTHVQIESTGIYWKPVLNILESALTLILINPEPAKALRGHKTDRKNAEWLADLLQLGLLQPSFIPPLDRRARRELTRYRESLVP